MYDKPYQPQPVYKHASSPYIFHTEYVIFL